MDTTRNTEERRLYKFGPYELEWPNGQLMFKGNPVSIQPRQISVLKLLLDSDGDIVSKEEMVQRVWEGAFIEDSNLTKAVAEIRRILRPGFREVDPIRTVWKIGYRLDVPVEIQALGGDVVASTPEATPQISLQPQPQPSHIPATIAPAVAQRKGGYRGIWVAAAVAVTLAGAAYWRVQQSKPKLTEKDSIVLADFNNATGDAVFDGTLRQGLSSQLEQSPFLNLISDQRITEILALMSKPKDSRLTAGIAREVCVRTASAATVEGSIAALGTQYVIGLKAVDCHGGTLLADEQVTADGKEQVLKALGRASADLRRKLGESLVSVQKYDVPLERVTTPSLEALQAFSLCIQAGSRGNVSGSIAPCQQAIALDPNFAMAYARLGASYSNTLNTSKSEEYSRKAYELRTRVSEREQLYIALFYHYNVTGNLEAARATAELYAQIYPRDYVPRNMLIIIYNNLGQYERAVRFGKDAIGIDPQAAAPYTNLGIAYFRLGRIDDMRAIHQEALRRSRVTPTDDTYLYYAESIEHNEEGMKRQEARLMGTPEESRLFVIQARMAASVGRFRQVQELLRQAAAAGRRSHREEAAAVELARGALNCALAGNQECARQLSGDALNMSESKDTVGLAAVALALAGDSGQALRLASDLAPRYPESTSVQFAALPLIRAALALQAGNGRQSVDALTVASAYDFANLSPIYHYSYSPYLRGQAYLVSKDGRSAAIEFQKILRQTASLQNGLSGLAHLGVGRAMALSGDAASAKKAYEDFFASWKDADPDVPILTLARAEFAKLH